MAKVRTDDIIKELKLELISGEEGIYKPITTTDISRPALELAGFFNYYPAERVQLLGRTEIDFCGRLTATERMERMEKLCDPATPGIIISRGLDIPEELLIAAEKHSVPLMRTTMKTTRFSSKLTNYLESRLAPSTAVHGVLVDIYGVGVLITGQSGVGKSETALALVERGHQLVADDCVEIREEDEEVLIGTAPELLEQLLEIRGLGIINVMTLFGAGAVRPSKKISLSIHLELWDDHKHYDRVGLDEEKIKIINTEITKLTIPVRPGRNLAVIIEVAAMNYRLKRLGVNAAQQFTERLTQVISGENNLD
ncbi:HPr(Ser) kinase/phosphatase [Lederbergia graminis]|uniref:HPr kinase/phosphorylase n=1 Tax=Lederbergia graminis TaxID=735518 RepID=A0ABW0LL92_9BACI